MSISNLFNDNNYTIKCRELECATLTAGDIINPTGIIDDLFTDRIRSGQTQNIVMNISSGNTVFHSGILPETPNVENIGTISSRWNILYANGVDTTGSANIGGILTVDNNANIDGTCIASELEVTSTCIIGSTCTVGEIVSNNGASITGPCIASSLQSLGPCSCQVLNTQNCNITNSCTLNNLQFTQGGNQSILNTFRFERFSPGLNVSGAISSVLNIRTPYSATRIGDYVCLTIEAFPEESCSSNTEPIILGPIDPNFRPGSSSPPANRSVACSLQVQTGVSTITMGEAIVGNDGNIRIYSGFTNGSLFTIGNLIRVGYSGTSYFTICYNV